MNAPAKVLVGEALQDAIWLLETRALIRAYLEYEHQYERLADAVDPLQEFADTSGLAAALGQDEVQRLIAEPFERFRNIVAVEIAAEQQEPAPDLPSDYAQRLVRDWEMADSRDRWRHTGELPPPARQEPAKRPLPIPQTTIEAFNYVLGLGDADSLRHWLRDPDPPKAPSRQIQRFSEGNKQAGPHHNPPGGGGSTDVSREAERIARNPGEIDPSNSTTDRQEPAR